MTGERGQGLEAARHVLPSGVAELWGTTSFCSYVPRAVLMVNCTG